MSLSGRSPFALAVSMLAVVIFQALAVRQVDVGWGSFINHEDARNRIIEKEELTSLGGTLELNAMETRANEILMNYKIREMEEGFANLTTYNPAQHFFARKPYVNQSPIFKFIKPMPKGSLLHAHDTGLIGKDFLLQITYMDNLYICFMESGEFKLHFFKSPPDDKQCTWNLIADVRKAHKDTKEFDNILLQHFSIEVDDPQTVYPDLDTVWKYFQNVFNLITPMLTYKPAWEMYFYESLKRYYEDGILYMEIRSTLPNLYDLEGTQFGPLDTLKSYKEVNDKFRADYPDSFGSRIIYAPLRGYSIELIHYYITVAKQAKVEFGDFLAGFDLAGQEDHGGTLHDYIDVLLTLPSNIDVFYHSGETNWYGGTDMNLIDAVLLGAKRLGHAYGLLKHPAVSKIVKDNDIAVEVNPISNQVLKLVDDLRNHPGSILIANNYPMVISSDDPGLFGSLPISHDFYMAFMGLASKSADLRLLKQLTINSIKYSSMLPEEKVIALQRHLASWDKFIHDFLLTHTDSIISVVNF